MNRLIRALLVGAVLVVAYVYFFIRKPTMVYALTQIKTAQDAISLFPKTVDQVNTLTESVIQEAHQELQKILTIPDDQRTYDNTAGALDRLASFSNIAVAGSLMVTQELIGTDEKIRDAASNNLLKIQAFFIDNVGTNKELYHAFKAYIDGNAKNEQLSDEQKRYLYETERDFKNAGLALPDEKLEQVKKLKKELVEIEQQFDKNIAEK